MSECCSFAQKAADAVPPGGKCIAQELPALSPNKALPWIKQAAEGATITGLHKPVGLVLASAYVLGTACQLSGVCVTWSVTSPPPQRLQKTEDFFTDFFILLRVD